MNASFASALAQRSVFVTGHTGFKGSWLAIWLHALGARVTGYSLAPPTAPNNFMLSLVESLLAAHHVADVRDTSTLSAALRAAQPDVVFHLAAQALVRRGYAAPQETFDVNVGGTTSLLEALRGLGRPCVVVVVTSDKCYAPRAAPDAFVENDPLGGDDPYSASKAAAELVTAAYRRACFPPERIAEHGVKLASVRAGNVIGGGDWAADRIVVDIVQRLADGQPVPLRYPQAIRPWQHVLEPLGGYLQLAAKMLGDDDARWCSAWNFGPTPGDDITVSTLTEKFIACWGAGTWQAQAAGGQFAETPALRLNIDKAKQVLGWQPRWSLDEAIRRTAAWYRRHLAAPLDDMLGACREDIAAYEAEA